MADGQWSDEDDNGDSPQALQSGMTMGTVPQTIRLADDSGDSPPMTMGTVPQGDTFLIVDGLRQLEATKASCEDRMRRRGGIAERAQRLSASFAALTECEDFMAFRHDFDFTTDRLAAIGEKMNILLG